MQGSNTLIKTRKASGALVTDGLGNDILMGTVYAFGACVIGVVGAWAFATLAVGVIHAGGPLVLLDSWISAVTGM